MFSQHLLLNKGPAAVAAAGIPVLGAGAHLLRGVDGDLCPGVDFGAVFGDGDGDLQELRRGGAGALLSTISFISTCPRILEHRSPFSDCCSADFGPRLPANQLYNNQQIIFGAPKSGSIAALGEKVQTRFRTVHSAYKVNNSVMQNLTS